MVVLEVFSKNIAIKYKSTIISKATFVVFIFGIITIILPFIFAYKSRGLWLKREVVFEQSNIKFTGKYLFMAVTSNLSFPLIACSTLPLFNEKLSILDHCSSIKFREVDHNYDGKVDEFILNINLTLPENLELTYFNLFLEFNYKINRCAFEMKSGIIHQQLLPALVSSFILVGDVVLRQNRPIACLSNDISNLYNFPIVVNEYNLDDFSKIITEYSKLNVSTILKNILTSFQTIKSQKFGLDINLRFPEHPVYYKPGFWQIVKWAWIQYFAIYTIVAWFIAKMKAYIFKKRFVLIYEINPITKMQ